MDIEKIFKNINYEILSYGINNKFNDMHYDSRNIEKNDIFVALIGSNVDGHKYIQDVVDKGASMIIVERKDINIPENIYVIYVENLRKNLGIIASNFYDYPQDKLKILGVTGTNGKTTSTFLLESILTNSSRVGTTGYRILDKNYESKNTTPESLDLIKLMKESVDKNVEYFIMEVSSHSLSIGRVNMLKLDGAIFTNLSQDHLDFHNTMEEYFEAKANIVKYLKPGIKLIVNGDDKYARRIQNTLSFSIENSNADIYGEVLEYRINGMLVKIVKDGKSLVITTNLVGKYNLQNLLGVILLLCNLGYDFEEVCKKFEYIKSIAGRFETIENNKEAMIIVDYAHSPDGLENILKTLVEIKKNRIITVFGAGGDRDKTKRPKMAQVACKYSDFIYLTSDNPRTEDPMKILEDIEAGMDGKVPYILNSDREESIKLAIESLKPFDILLIAGKGHEDYQIIGKVKYHFDDREIVRKYLGGIN